MKATLIQSPEGAPNFCFGLYAGDDCLTFVQSDWDYAGLARSCGWDISTVQASSPRRGFDFKAECGVSICDDCGYPLYPMEFEESECPECGGHCTELIRCDHERTDGTVDCKCGVKVSQFLASAFDYLSDHDGEEFEVDDCYADCAK